MSRIWASVVVVVVAGCGIQPSAVTDEREAPTGVAAGPTLYFIDASDRLAAEQRRSGHLGTISDALALLLAGPGGSGRLRTQISPVAVTRVGVTITPGLIQLRLPLTIQDVTALGIDQIVCTALGVQVQSGGPRTLKVQLQFTLETPESDRLRTCPLIK